MIKHAKVLPGPDDADPNTASPSDWNADHEVDDNTLVAAKLAASANDVAFGRVTAGAGKGEEFSFLSLARSLVAKATAREMAQVLGLPYAILKTGVAVSGAADANENTLATVSLPANALGANGCLIVQGHVTLNNNANAKTFRGRFSGIGGTIMYSFNLANTLNFVFRWIMFNQNATNSQLSPPSIAAAFGTSAGASVSAAVDTTGATTFLITGQKAVGADTITLNNVLALLISDGT